MTYTGQFHDNVPHGAGQFLYPNGDVEDVVMEAGVRHGQSRYHCDEDNTDEEVVFHEGVPQGPSKVSEQFRVICMYFVNDYQIYFVVVVS